MIGTWLQEGDDVGKGTCIDYFQSLSAVGAGEGPLLQRIF